MSELNLAFLGPLQITHRQWGKITFANRKTLALFAYLAVESASAHRRESLLEMLWPDLPTSDAQNNLRVTWSQLRQRLQEDPDASNPYLIGTRLDLQFNPHSDYALDLRLFRDLLEACHTHKHISRPECAECAERLAQATALVHGEFLAGLLLGDCPVFDEWLFIQRERLHLQITAALEDLADFHEHAGSAAQSVQYVQRLLEFDPLRERAHRHLMRLLAAAGQRSAALEQYQTCRRLLANKLGVAPEPETVQLAEQIKALVSIQNEVPHHNLPPALTRFFGRSTEIADLQQLLTQESGGSVTLVGPGGVGKTRLSLQIAHDLLKHFSDGVWLVELAGVQTASAVPDTVASALNLMPDGKRSPTRMIGDYLREKSVLLILDNCEHVLEACAQLVKALRSAAPKLAILATSRTPLHLDDERIIRLQPFPAPEVGDSKTLITADALQFDSIQLFVHCAAQSLLSFTLNDANTSAVAQICQHLDGIPLAIEIAAARAGSMPVEAIAKRLYHRFRWLNAHSSSTRQRTLHALIDWSYDLLDEQERALLCRLSVFAGGWTLEAAEAISEDEENCADILGRLVDQSLVVFGDDPGGRRYHIHETIRQFAAEKLMEQGNEVKTEIFQRHSQIYLTMLETVEKKLTGVDSSQVGLAMRPEIFNIRNAWRWAVNAADWEQIRYSTPGLVAFYNYVGLPVEVVELLQIAIDSPELNLSTEVKLRPFLMAKQLTLLYASSTLDELMPRIEALLALTQGKPELAREEVEAYLNWSMALLDQESNSQKARVYLDRAFTRVAGLNDPEYEALLICESGRNYAYNGQFEEAIESLQRALSIFQSLDHIPGQALVYSRLGPAYAESHDLGPALFCDQEALRLYTQINQRSNFYKAHNNLAESFAMLGAYEQARDHAAKSLLISHEQGNKVGEANTLTVYATSLNGLGQTEEAEKQYRKAIRAQKEMNMNWSLSFSLLEWGAFQLSAGWLEEAEKTFNEALVINRDMRYLYVTTQSDLAMVYLAQDKQQQALTFADEIWKSIAPTQGKGLPFPIKTLFECYSIFHACGDARAKEALSQAAEVLKQSAAGIDDIELRESFLHNVPVNRSVQQALQNPLG